MCENGLQLRVIDVVFDLVWILRISFYFGLKSVKFFSSVGDGDSYSSLTAIGGEPAILPLTLTLRASLLVKFGKLVFYFIPGGLGFPSEPTYSIESEVESIRDILRSMNDGDFLVLEARNTVSYRIGLVYFCSSLSWDFTLIWKMSAESRKAWISFSSWLASSLIYGLLIAGA